MVSQVKRSPLGKIQVRSQVVIPTMIALPNNQNMSPMILTAMARQMLE